ncbi:MAG: PRC-barrel domain-containing protein [Nitrososphaerales archaeon]
MVIIINRSAIPMEQTEFDLRNEPVTYEDLKGMKVVDTNGEKVGTLRAVHIDPITLTITALMVRRGFKNIFIHRDSVERIGKNCVMLKIPPVIEAMEVIDINGEKVGRVNQIFKNEATNMVELIEIRTGFANQPLKIPKHEIHGIGKKVVLRHTKGEYASNRILE